MTVFFNDFLFTVLGISIIMSAVTVLLALLRRPMKKYFKAGSRFAIWALVMLRLCIPVGGVLFPSVVNIADVNESSSVLSGEDFSYDAVGVQDPDALIPEIESPPIRDLSEGSETYAPSETDTSSVKEEKAFTVTAEAVSTAVFIVWSSGALIFVLRYTLKYNISASYIRKSSHDADSDTAKLFSAICSEMKLKRAPRLAVSEAVDSPMLYGYFKPTVVMPAISFSEDAARGILSHELTHYKRGDLYLKLCAMLGNAIHWFNPFAYAASKIFSREMELSCDEKVLMLYDEDMRINYGRIMLDIVAKCRRSDAPLTTGFNPRVNAVRERMTNILDSHKKHKGSVFVSLTLIACISAGSLLGYNVNAYDADALHEELMKDEAAEAETVYADDTRAVEESETGSAEAETAVPHEETDIIADTEANQPPEESLSENTETAPNAESSLRGEENEAAEAPTQQADAASDEESNPAEPASDTTAAPVTSHSRETETAAPVAESKPHSHSYTVTKTAATCSQNGMNVYECSCGDSYRTVVYKTHKHSTRHQELTVTADGEQITYYAEICTVCGTEIGYKKTIWDGTSISYYISGPFYYDGEYNSEGELVIYGSGDMSTYCSLGVLFTYSDSDSAANGDLPPWWLYSSEYDSIVIAEGITCISANAFSYCCEYVNTVTVGKTVKNIEKNAFESGSDIKTLYLPVSLESISEDAFPDSNGIHIKYEGTAEDFAKLDLGNLAYASVEYNVEY